MVCSSSLAFLTGLSHAAKDQVRVNLLDTISKLALSQQRTSSGRTAVRVSKASTIVAGVKQLVMMELMSMVMDMVRAKADEFGRIRLKRFMKELVFSRLLQQDLAYFEEPNRTAFVRLSSYCSLHSVFSTFFFLSFFKKSLTSPALYQIRPSTVCRGFRKRCRHADSNTVAGARSSNACNLDACSPFTPEHAPSDCAHPRQCYPRCFGLGHQIA